MRIAAPRLPNGLWALLAGWLLAGVAGALLGTGQYLLLVLLIGTIMGGALLLLPRLAVWVLGAGALVVAGLLELYLPAARQVAWLVAALAVALGAQALVRRIATHHMEPGRHYPQAETWAALFLLSTVLTTFFNGGVSMSSVAGLKGYFQVWGLMMALCWFNYSRTDLWNVSKALLVLAAIQLPFAVHQLIFLVPQRAATADAQLGIVAADIVTGTFGGNLTGGGRSLNLAILACTMLALVILLFRSRRLSKRQSLLVGAAVMAPLMISEVKVLLILLPVTLYLASGLRLREDAGRLLVGGAWLSLGFMVLLFIYANLPGAKSQEAQSIEYYFEDIISSNFGDRGYGMLRLNRMTVYAFWFQENVLKLDLVHALIGHGAGASGGSVFSEGSLSQTIYTGQGIGLTSVSSLLWDVGLLGLVLITGFLIHTVRAAATYCRGQPLNRSTVAVKTAQIGLVLIMVGCLHSNYLVFDLSYQALTAIFCGIIIRHAYLGRETA